MKKRIKGERAHKEIDDEMSRAQILCFSTMSCREGKKKKIKIAKDNERYTQGKMLLLAAIKRQTQMQSLCVCVATKLNNLSAGYMKKR